MYLVLLGSPKLPHPMRPDDMIRTTAVKVSIVLYVTCQTYEIITRPRQSTGTYLLGISFLPELLNCELNMGVGNAEALRKPINGIAIE